MNLVTCARTGVGENDHVRQVCQFVLLEHGGTVIATVPHGNEVELYLWIGLHSLRPSAAFQFRQTISAPRRPEMNHAGGLSFDTLGDFLFGGRIRANGERKRQQEKSNEFSHYC